VLCSPTLTSHKPLGVIFNTERFAIHDGPGIRTVVFLKGCPLRCLWCSSPEGQKVGPELLFFGDKCIKCGQCSKACLKNAITETKDDELIIDRNTCNNCGSNFGKCTERCYTGSLVVKRRYVAVEEIISEILKDEPFYRRSGGGVTFSGGEPTYQPEFLLQSLRMCGEYSLNRVIETCGYTKWEVFEQILKHLDLVYFDIKHMDPTKHRQYTNVSNELILSNIKQVSLSGVPMVLRIPVVPGYNDSERNVRETAKFALTLQNLMRIELLPYHRLGLSKYRALGLDYRLAQVTPPSRENILQLKQIVENFGLKCQIGG